MRPPGLGVSPTPRASQDQKVQPRTSHHIYGGATTVLLTILRLPYQQQLTTLTTTRSAMDVSYCSPLQLQENNSSFLFDCEALLDKSYDPLTFDPASDPGYVSASSSLSPTSSVDSFCFSPAALLANKTDALDCFIFSNHTAPPPTQETLPCSTFSAATSTTKKSRTRYPGKKRQTASEREKMRMRDLTKAMHHLRSYLPPSVAPAGQTLTKIETLRLTVRYISYLSAQLGLSEEVLEQRTPAAFLELPKTLNQYLGEPAATYSSQEPGCEATSSAQLFALQNSYQVCSCHNN